MLRLCADGVHGIIQQITFAGGELPDGPIIAADIIRGGELAAFVGGVGVYQFLTPVNAIDGTGKCCVSLRQTRFGIPLGDGGAPLFQDIADLCLCDRVPLHRRRLVLRDNITDARIHLGEDVVRANEYVGEHRFSVAAGHGVFVHRKPCKGCAGQMKLHTLVQTVLGGFDHLQAAPFQCVVEGHGGNLTGDHGHLAHLLGFIPVIALLCYGVNAGAEIIELHFAVCIGRHSLLRAVAGNGEGDTGHLAVLTGFDDLDAAIADLQMQIGVHGVADGIPEGDDILHGAVGAIVTVAPDHHALTGIVSDGGNGHTICGSRLGGDGQVIPIDGKGHIRLGRREGIFAQNAVGVRQGSRVAAAVPTQFNRLCSFLTAVHEAGDDGVLFHAGLDAVIVGGEAAIQRMGGAVDGLHGIGAAGVNVVEIFIPFSDNRFPHQHLRGHHVGQLVGVGIILRAPVEGEIPLIAVLHDAAEERFHGSAINGAVILGGERIPIVLSVAFVGTVQVAGNTWFDAVAGRAVEGADGVQRGHPCCLAGCPAVHVVQLVVAPCAAVIQIGIAVSGERHRVRIRRFSGGCCGIGRHATAENGGEADQQGQQPGNASAIEFFHLFDLLRVKIKSTIRKRMLLSVRYGLVR